MIDHVLVGAEDIAAARSFYVVVLATVGLRIVDEGAGPLCGLRRGRPLEPEFSVETPTNGRRAGPGNGVHIAFRAPSRAAVDAFHAAALAAGGRSDGAPGPRPNFMGHTITVRSCSTWKATRSRPSAMWRNWPEIRGRAASHRDLRAQLHHPAGGDVEEVGGVGGVLHQEDEQLVLPQRHAATGPRAPPSGGRGRSWWT